MGREHLIRDYENSQASGSSRYRSSQNNTTSGSGTRQTIDPLDKYYGDILGLNNDFSLENIKKKYRSKMKENHPDSNASLSETERKRAEEAAKRINSAYAYFKKRLKFN
jgi:preprotein translocase subunit Sec63